MVATGIACVCGVWRPENIHLSVTFTIQPRRAELPSPFGPHGPWGRQNAEAPWSLIPVPPQTAMSSRTRNGSEKEERGITLGLAARGSGSGSGEEVEEDAEAPAHGRGG
jgi:hypothetical protein